MRLIWSSLLIAGLLAIAMDVLGTKEEAQPGGGSPPPSFEDGTGLPPPDPTPTPR